MTKKQAELIADMKLVLDTEFDHGCISKNDYTVTEASKLIFLNKDMFFLIMNEGQCTVKQYNQLTEIAGRRPKFERHEIGFFQATQWINKYLTKSA